MSRIVGGALTFDIVNLQVAIDVFQELDSRINSVATKVVYLGDQLENVNTPRSRAVEAQKLLTLFNGFLKPGDVLAPVFTDKDQVSRAR